MLKLRILDLAKHTTINPFYESYMKMLHWDRERAVKFRDQRVQELITHAYSHVPYYRNLMQQHGITPAQIQTAADLQLVPVLDKEIIRANQQSLLADNVSKEKLHQSSSSGTTGVPVTYYHDDRGISAGIASGYALWSMSGWKPGDRHVHIWGNTSSIKRWNTWSSRMKNKLVNQKNVPSFFLDNPDQLRSVSEEIRKFNPSTIEGYSTAVYTLAQYFRETKQNIPGLKQVFTTAENLEDYQRTLIEDVLAPASDLYGCGEIMGIAARPVNDERYYIFEPHVVIETADSGIDGMKDILVTDLDNYGMPFIRYKVGDMIDDIYQPDASSVYPLPHFKKIMGRTSDVITLPGGKRFHPVNIFGGTLFRKFPGITRHKVIWDGSALKFIFEAEDLPDKNELTRQLELLLAQYEVPFTTEFVKKILPGTNGKYRYFEITGKQS